MSKIIGITMPTASLGDIFLKTCIYNDVEPIKVELESTGAGSVEYSFNNWEDRKKALNLFFASLKEIIVSYEHDLETSKTSYLES